MNQSAKYANWEKELRGLNKTLADITEVSIKLIFNCDLVNIVRVSFRGQRAGKTIYGRWKYCESHSMRRIYYHEKEICDYFFPGEDLVIHRIQEMPTIMVIRREMSVVETLRL